MVEFFTQRLGNAYVIGLGGCEIAKFWFTKEGESHSILSEDEAKNLAEDMCRFFEQKYDVAELDDEEFGGCSEISQFVLKMYDDMLKSLDCKE